MNTGEQYGEYFWTVKSKKDGEVTMNACKVAVTDNGDLVFTGCSAKLDEDRTHADCGHIRAVFASGTWEWLHASSCLDGSAVAAGYWKGQCERRERMA